MPKLEFCTSCGTWVGQQRISSVSKREMECIFIPMLYRKFVALEPQSRVQSSAANFCVARGEKDFRAETKKKNTTLASEYLWYSSYHLRYKQSYFYQSVSSWSAFPLAGTFFVFIKISYHMCFCIILTVFFVISNMTTLFIKRILSDRSVSYLANHDFYARYFLFCFFNFRHLGHHQKMAAC